ncbi:MAG: hemolysin family protein [Candidatus Promineifilaceae bacterium]|nr:hemolysin family protein [Candidatus Promineifilaceae bacterium]
MVGLLILILINGLFSMSEIAVVAARKTRLQQRAAEGDKGAQSALALANEPDNFLATIQVGITLVAILMGAVGSTQIAAQLQPYLAQVPFLANYSAVIAGISAVVVVTYLSLVLGELAPKQVGLNRAESVAARVAPFMTLLAQIANPLVRFLSASTRLLLRLFRLESVPAQDVTEDDIQMMIAQATESGEVEPIEEQLVEQVFRVGDLRVNDLMVDRRDIQWLDVNDPPDVIRQKIGGNIHSRYPVARGNLDDVIGLVFVKEMFVHSLEDNLKTLESLVKPALFIPSGLPVYQVLEKFKETQAQIAFITDEHGGVSGLVTFIDLIEALVGDVPEIVDPANPTAVRRDDGSWLVDGRLPIEEFKELFELPDLAEDENYYQTVGGFVMRRLGHIPTAGEVFSWRDLRIEVVDMDWRRVDKVLVKKLEA